MIYDRKYELISECRATNCYTIWIADQRLNNQTNDQANAMLPRNFASIQQLLI